MHLGSKKITRLRFVLPIIWSFRYGPRALVANGALEQLLDPMQLTLRLGPPET